MRENKLSLKELKETLQNGMVLLADNKLDLAYDQFEKILNARFSAISPKIYAKAMSGMGKIFSKRNRFREAKTCFKRAYEKNPTNINYLIEYAAACKCMRWYSEAMAAWKKCLLVEKNDIQIIIAIAECFDLLGNFVKAKEYYSKAFKIDSENKHVLWGLGNLYFNNDLYLDATYYWEKLVCIRGFHEIEVLSSLGHCYRKRKEYKKAMEYYHKTLLIDQKDVRALGGLAKINHNLKKEEQEKLKYREVSSV